MKASQLRDLTRKYAAGGLAREDYVAERKRLIEGVVSGEIELRHRNLEPAIKANGGNSERKRWLVLGGSILLVGMLLVAVLAYFVGDNTGREAAGTKAAPVSALEPGSDLLREFVQAGQWSNEALDSLEAKWQQLTAFQQESARRSTAYRQLKHETNQRIIEQEALLAAGEMDALLMAGRLREFAGKLGFSGD